MLLASYCYHTIKVPFNPDYKIKITGYCYHLVNAISFQLAQSDHIKRLLLYFENELHYGKDMRKCRLATGIHKYQLRKAKTRSIII